MVGWLNGGVGSEGRCDFVQSRILGQRVAAEKSGEVTFR